MCSADVGHQPRPDAVNILRAEQHARDARPVNMRGKHLGPFSMTLIGSAMEIA